MAEFLVLLKIVFTLVGVFAAVLVAMFAVGLIMAAIAAALEDE